MPDKNIVSIRVSSDFKARLVRAARRRKTTVSGYLKDLAEEDWQKEAGEGPPPTEREREVVRRFVGMIDGNDLGRKRRRSLTNEEIDKVVYGDL